MLSFHRPIRKLTAKGLFATHVATSRVRVAPDGRRVIRYSRVAGSPSDCFIAKVTARGEMLDDLQNLNSHFCLE